MKTIWEARSWADATFGKVKLGDRRCVARLVAMATRAVFDSSGRVTEVFRTTPSDKKRATFSRAATSVLPPYSAQ